MRRQRKQTDSELGIAGYVAVDVPTRRKADGAYTIRTVKSPYHDGEAPDVVQAFADAQLASLATYRAAHPLRPGTGLDQMYTDPSPIITPDGREWERPPAPVVPEPGAFAAFAARAARDHESILRLAAELDARKGRTRSPLATEASENAAPVAKPRARKVAASPRIAQIREAIAAEPVTPPDALTTCNGCDMRPMVGPDHPGYAAGYCAECFAEANPPAPAPADDWAGDAVAETLRAIDAMYERHDEPEPPAYRDSDVAHMLATSGPEHCWHYARSVGVPPRRCLLNAHDDTTPHEWPPEPMPTTPVPSYGPAPTRPTCPRCGQTFRLSGRGYAWHLANRLDCARTGAAAA